VNHAQHKAGIMSHTHKHKTYVHEGPRQIYYLGLDQCWAIPGRVPKQTQSRNFMDKCSTHTCYIYIYKEREVNLTLWNIAKKVYGRNIITWINKDENGKLKRAVVYEMPSGLLCLQGLLIYAWPDEQRTLLWTRSYENEDFVTASGGRLQNEYTRISPKC
jgi:hypothetical protein